MDSVGIFISASSSSLSSDDGVDQLHGFNVTSPLNILIVGASGRTGNAVLEQGLARGHRITALLRTPAPLRPHARLRMVAGDPLHLETLISTMPGHDLVISCLGQRRRADSNLLQHAAHAMMLAMAQSDVRRYVVISQALLFPSNNPFVALLRLLLSRYVADSAAMEKIVTESNTDWTIVRPTRLLRAGSSRGYRAQAGARPPGPASMRRIDLAAFLLDEAQKGEYRRATVGVTSA